ncbi:hypothetical protein [Oleiharenicola sp. Vm1]|uniref:hypothetical protein n=1 Tax=Oleiharenicola sp. Vm1 TaxID=3398393 RepID=UPI0039F56814
MILISGYSAADTARRCAQLGAVAFLQKPFEISALHAELRKHLGERSRARDGRPRTRPPAGISPPAGASQAD